MNIIDDVTHNTVTVTGLSVGQAHDLRSVIRLSLDTTAGKVQPDDQGAYAVVLDMPRQFDMAESRGLVLGAVKAWAHMWSRS